MILLPLVRVILQARTSSSRLPGKGLLPVKGIPASILAALRVRGSNWETLFATSDDPSDDPLAKMARTAGLTVVRGPLKDVLGRFVAATEDLPDEAIVIRLTGDNVFPDAHLIDEVVNVFLQRACEYMITWTPFIDVPEGLTAEIFRARALRQAAKYASTPPQREHVTPWIRQTFGDTTYRPSTLPVGYGRLRCTIDRLDDYLRIVKVFDAFDDPLKVHWMDLCARLAALPDAPSFVVPLVKSPTGLQSRLIMGTAQLGISNEIRNEIETLSEKNAIELVHTALRHGITHFDTARAYDQSEYRLGLALSGDKAGQAQVITKLIPLDKLDDDVSKRWLTHIVDASVFRSCRELRTATLPTLLVHRAKDRTAFGGNVWKRLLALRDQGVIGVLGVCARSPEEALLALEDPDVGHLHIPFTILGGRWKHAGVDAAARRRRDVTIHARSPLLGGLPATWPRLSGTDTQAFIDRLDHMTHVLQRESLIDLAFAYVRSHDWIHGIVSGFESPNQLTEVVRLFNRPLLDQQAIDWIDSSRGEIPPPILAQIE